MPNPKEPIVGIDLGTTYSLVAVLRDGVPTVLPNALGKTLTPSAVSVEKSGQVFVGESALSRQSTHAADTVTAFKRDMGTARTHRLGGREYSPQALSALVLRSLKADAEAALGMPVREAVITVPAYFDEGQRRATRDAALLAGLRADRIINEPTAAALAYGLHHRNREFSAVVLDLGGGTFDVTVMDVIEGVMEIRSTAGDTRLGGEDFVWVLLDHALGEGRIERASLTPNSLGRLQAACEAAKRRLSSEPEAMIAVSDLERTSGRAVEVRVRVTRDQAESLWAPLLARLRAPIVKALNDANQAAAKVDEILLVGGATRMPCVVALVGEVFGRPASTALPPDEAVAMGAAVQAALKARDAAVEDLVVTDIAPFTMGTAVLGGMGSMMVEGIYLPVLERGTVIPASRMKTLSTVRDNQKLVEVEIFQGEHSLCRDNTFLGKFTLDQLPPRPAGGVVIDLRFTYDINSLLEVEATVRETQQKKSIVLENAPGRLSPEKIAETLENFKRLKFHPRDAQPNVATLTAAEALYTELKGMDREALAQLLAAFRAALESQDASLIDGIRESLTGFLAQAKQQQVGSLN